MTDAVPPQPQSPSASRGFALGLICAAQLMLQLDFSIVNVALATIQHGLGFSPVMLQWVVTGYALSYGSLLLLLSATVGGLAFNTVPQAGMVIGLGSGSSHGDLVRLSVLEHSGHPSHRQHGRTHHQGEQGNAARTGQPLPMPLPPFAGPSHGERRRDCGFHILLMPKLKSRYHSASDRPRERIFMLGNRK